MAAIGPSATGEVGRRSGGHSAIARLAVVLAAGVAVCVGLCYEMLAVSYATDGAVGIADNWLGGLGGLVLALGLAGALAAFVMALLARRQETWGLLRLPLLLFPGLVAAILLVEVTWSQ